MRRAIICMVILWSVAIVSTNGSQIRNKLTNLLSMNTSAVDAVESALNVLYDLKEANTDSQNQAHQLYQEQQAQCQTNIAEIQSMVADNKNTADNASIQSEKVEEEIKDTNDYLEWIVNRVQQINNKREQLEEQRCVSNAFFIRALKEHSEVISVIELLKKDLQPNTSKTDFIQVKSVSDKLKSYSRLFNNQAIKEFNQLSSTQARDVDKSNLDWNNDANDNNKDELQLKKAENGSTQRNTKTNLGDRLIDLLDKLKINLEQSIEELTKNEIQSAWDLATWLHLSEEELEHLSNEAERKNIYVEKQKIQFQQAKAHEAQSWQIHDSSVLILNSISAECEGKQNSYNNETQRRDRENKLIDEIIEIFEQRVLSMNNNIKQKLNDYSNNQQGNSLLYIREKDNHKSINQNIESQSYL